MQLSSWLLRVWWIGLVVAPGCKTSVGLVAGSLPATGGPALIHEPMGIGRVRFAYQETGDDFEDKESLRVFAGGGSYTTGHGSTAKTRYVSEVWSRGDHSQEGVKQLSASTWAANVHVDVARWSLFPLLFFMGHAYVEAQGELVKVGR